MSQLPHSTGSGPCAETATSVGTLPSKFSPCAELRMRSMWELPRFTTAARPWRKTLSLLAK